MKTLITAIALTIATTSAFAGAEVPADTIPGYSVNPARAVIQQADVNSELRSESLAYTVPGYGVTASRNGRIWQQTEVGSSGGYDYLGQTFEGNQ